MLMPFNLIHQFHFFRHNVSNHCVRIRLQRPSAISSMINFLVASLPLRDRRDDTKHICLKEEADRDTRPLPVPPPPTKLFYHSRSTQSQSKLDLLFARYPHIGRHRRCFAVAIFALSTTIILLIILGAIPLSRKGHGNSGNHDGPEDGGPGDGGGGYGDGPSTPDSELAKHNQGVPHPPINHSNATGWNNHGQGDATFYGIIEFFQAFDRSGTKNQAGSQISL